MADAGPAAGEPAHGFYEDAPFGYLLVEAIDGQILQLNRTMRRWLGYPEGEAPAARRFADLLSPAGRILYATRHVPLLQTAGVAEGVSLELMRRDGSRLPVLMNSVVQREADGTPRATRAALFDATNYRRSELRLIEARDRAERSEIAARQALAAVEAADRSKARFLAAMNHEFRTPIGIIAGFAELMLEAAEDGGPSPTLNWTRDIAAAATHLLELLEDATRYAALHRPDLRLQRSDGALAQAVQAGAQRAAAALKRAQVTTDLDLASEATASLDPALAAEAIGAVLRELAHRAGPGAVLQVRSHHAPGCVSIRCATLSLSPDALAGFWDQPGAGDVLQRGLEGAGLGLGLAQTIMAMHDGAIQVVSDAAGGTEVRMQFGSAAH